MTTSSYCEICNEKEALYKCRVCGRNVCEEHVSPEGVCAVCSTTICEFCGKRLSIGYCIVCGRLGCRECLIQLDPSRRICPSCLAEIRETGKNTTRICRPGTSLAKSVWG
ncbi:MAG: hypothetical protein F7C32_00910 [Desulfurococcales archaeon]|nr:hypothetical protein [Desulfurococcales archaeon]